MVDHYFERGIMDKQLEVQLRRLISMAVKAKEIESDTIDELK